LGSGEEQAAQEQAAKPGIFHGSREGTLHTNSKLLMGKGID
jgi:hypothetical protein